VDSMFDVSQVAPRHEVPPCCGNRREHGLLDRCDEVEIEPSGNSAESRPPPREHVVGQSNQPGDEGKGKGNPEKDAPDTQQQKGSHRISHPTSVRTHSCGSG
jgi:hypothetical protein